jgi:hypothetical protein
LAELTTPSAPLWNGTIFLWRGHPSFARRGMRQRNFRDARTWKKGGAKCERGFQ